MKTPLTLPTVKITARNREVTNTGYPYGGTQVIEVEPAEVVALGKLTSWGDNRTLFWLRLQDDSEVYVKVCDQDKSVQRWIKTIAKREYTRHANRSEGWRWMWIPVKTKAEQ